MTRTRFSRWRKPVSALLAGALLATSAAIVPPQASAAVPEGLQVVNVANNAMNFGQPASRTGPDKDQGAVYLYSDVITKDGITVDAKVTIASRSSNASLAQFDNNFPADADLQKRLNPWITTTSGEGSFTLKIDFYDHATSLPVQLQNFYMTVIDVDGDNSSTEFIEASAFASYTASSKYTAASNPKGLTITSVAGGKTRFRGIPDGINNTVFNDRDSFVTNYTAPISSMTVVVGNTGPMSSRQFSINFGASGIDQFKEPIQTINNPSAPTLTVGIADGGDGHLTPGADDLAQVVVSGDVNAGTGSSVTGQPVTIILKDAANGTKTYSTNVDGSGRYELPIDMSAYPKGPISAEATVVNADGNPSAVPATAATIKDNTAPAAADIAKNGSENQPVVFAAIDFTSRFTDADGADVLSKVRLNELPAHGTLMLGDAPVTDGQEIDAADLGALAFLPDESWTGSTGFAWNGSDGTAYGAAPARVTIAVAGVNHAPTVADFAKNGTEDLPVTFAPSDFAAKFSDPDAGNELVYVKVTSLPANGGLTLDGTPVTAGQEIPAADLDGLAFHPAESWTGTTSFAWNGSDGQAYAASPATATIAIAPGNYAPTVSDIAKNGTEDQPVAFAASDFAGHFADEDEADALAVAKLTNLPSNGTLKLDGANVTEGQEIPAAQLDKLTFVPAANWSGSASFAWNGSDGKQYAAAPATVTVTIAAANDAPTVSDIAKNGTEDEALTFAAADFADKFADVDEADGLVLVKAASLPAHGTLKLDGEAVTEGQEVPAAALPGLIFAPDADWNGATTFQWNGSDGTAYAAVPATVTITIGEANDKPTANPQAVSADQELPIVITLTGSDPETPAGELTYAIATGPQHGEGSLSGREYAYMPADGFTGTDTVTLTVSDGDAISEPATVTITVKPLAPLDGWAGERKQGETAPYVIVSPGSPLKLSAASSPEAVKVTATVNGEATDLTLTNGGTAAEDGKKVWAATGYRLPDTIASGDYGVQFVAYDRNGGALQTEKPFRVGEDNAFHVRAQINLTGTISDQESGAPIAGASVALYDSTGTVPIGTPFVTPADGKYRFAPIKTGNYLLIVKKDGFGTKRSAVRALPDNLTQTDIVRDYALVPFAMTLSASPSAIVGDGASTSALRAVLTDKDGKPIAGVRVAFSAPRGTFAGGAEAVTDKDGAAVVTYKSEKIEGILSQNIVVTATVDDPEHNLYAVDQIIVTFQPASITGIITDNNADADHDGKPDPIAGAIVRITKDFDGDGVIDFSGEAVTNADGSYTIAIPRGDEEYDVAITQTIERDGQRKTVTFNQKAQVGVVTGAGGETFASTKTVSGLIGTKDSNGKGVLSPPVASSLVIYLKDGNGDYVLDGASGEPKRFPVGADGVFSAADLAVGTYAMEVRFVHDDGEEIIINRLADGSLPTVGVTADGQLNIAQELIDPYGTITDAKSGKTIEGAHVVLYYADTARNRGKGIAPDTAVALPGLTGFAPNDNANPQDSDAFGKYAYMVYGHTDYYLVATKAGYSTYTSPTLSVEDAIVRHDFGMAPIEYPGGPIVAPPAKTDADAATNLQLGGTVYPEGTKVTVEVQFSDLSEQAIEGGKVTLRLPDGVKVDNADGGTVSGSVIAWTVPHAEPGKTVAFRPVLALPQIDGKSQTLELVSGFQYDGKLLHPEWTVSSVKLTVVSDRYGDQEHQRYMQGYPDGRFHTDRSLTRAELAAIMARLLGKYDGADPGYKDVPAGHWASGYIRAVTAEGLFQGYEDHRFLPDQPVTRAELTAVMARFLNLKAGTPIALHFKDIQGSWASSAIEALYRNRMISGYGDGTFKPNNAIKRVEAVVLINAMLFRGPLTDIAPTFPDVPAGYWGFGQIEEASVSHASSWNDEGEEHFIKQVDDQVK
ncbi:tandem-95 repeat protein [Paenibacillus sp. MWE-103]|uniref:Tandem-95 repeat protein n=1 Tax=Paenibacillus artemisiicola TaxID=1172618 RepID=A0ABS3WGN8_9BACL|nr:tandem-95 repeat protein [Paenibacillus artemisiicola]MBO7747450.1 tandem-95 repeat protein [Paenibacillus artemisiicola]